MKLIVKLPKGKKPFIGILFNDSLESQILNADLVNIFSHISYSIKFNFEAEHVNVQLIGEEEPIIRSYNNLSYDADRLKNWFLLTKNVRDFNFSQIHLNKISQETVALVIKTQKLFILKVNGYQITEK